MSSFDWRKNKAALEGFGGFPKRLTIRKTGLPFYDALRLYGAIDLWVGIREDLSIKDFGDRWRVEAHCRPAFLRGRAERAFSQVWKKKTPDAKSFCKRCLESLESDSQFEERTFVPATKAMAGIDAALQAGIRDAAAAKYGTLQSGQTSESTCCVAKIPLCDALLAFAGNKRTEGLGDIVFLPNFRGRVDFSKVVSPLRLRLGVPNPLCAQALGLLSLKTSLFAEGYQDRLTGIVFKTSFRGQRSDNYSGIVEIASTAIGNRKISADFLTHLHRVFRNVVRRAWVRRGRGYETSKFTQHALAMAYWLMQPNGKRLSAMISAQERLHREKLQTIFKRREYAEETFEMSYEQVRYGKWKGDSEAVRRFANAVASGIFYARMKGDDDPRKAWYNEVTLLRSAPSPKSFIERSMILVEQGRREDEKVRLGADFDPTALFSSIGSDDASFETFRDLFRMYLIQASYWVERRDSEDRATSGGDGPVERAGTKEGRQ